MGLLSEQVRDITSESTLLSDSTEYVTASTTIVTLHDYGNIVVPKAGLVCFKIMANRHTTGSNGFLRLKVGSLYVYAHIESSGGTPIAHYCFCYLAAGTYDVLIEGRCLGASSDLHVTLNWIAFFAFTDMQGSALASYSAQINITPAARSTCIGDLKEAVFRIQMYAVTAAAATNFEDVGDSLTNGVSLAVDGSQITFAVRDQDTSGSGDGAHADYFCKLAVGSSHSFVVSKDNVNTTVSISIVACPWLMFSSLHQPVTLNIPQGSTLYLMLEPLDGLIDPTRYVYIGKVRACSRGDATDYYYTLSGTGIQTATYTFEIVDGGSSLLYVKASTDIGACISHIAVDLR